MEKSIYRMICENINDGVLNEGFSLSDEGLPGVSFAPGAFDGMCIYHMGYSGLNAAETKQMAQAIKYASDGDYEKADDLFAEWTKRNRAVSVVDDLQKYVIDHQNELNLGNICNTALSMVRSSWHAECVKIGLELLELFRVDEEDIREMIRNLSLYEEFSLFALWNIRKWEDGNQEVFELAKKLGSWGKIHAVEILQPQTEEIRRWLLFEGTFNEVVNAYSAYTCWQKSGAEEILSGQPSEETYKALLKLINALLDEGPVRGISLLEDPEKTLLRLTELAGQYELDTDDYQVFLSLRHWADDREEPIRSLSSACIDLLHSEHCLRLVREAVKRGKALELAEELGIPFRTQLLECLKHDFENYYCSCGYLMNDRIYVEPVLRVFRKNLPLSQMEGEPEDSLGFGEKYRKYDQLQFVLQELGNLPLTGMDLMMAGLKSPVSRNRNRVLANLKEWVKMKGQPLETLCPQLYEAVRRMREKEVNAGGKHMIEELLSGKTTFDEDEEE